MLINRIILTAALGLLGFRAAAQTIPIQEPKRDRPILVALLRGKFTDQKALISFWNGVLSDRDFVLPVSSSDPNYGTGFKAKRLTLSGGLLHGVTAAADRLKGQGAWIVYDLEGARPGPNVPKELQDELKDYVSSVKTAGDAVHKNGGKLMFTPTYPDILKYGARFAPYCDMINMQISSYTPGYAARVKETAQILRAANPKAIVLVQLGAISQTSPKQNTDPKQAIEAWKSVRSIVDGVLPYYVNDPNPIPMLKQFCDAILNQ